MFEWKMKLQVFILVASNEQRGSIDVSKNLHFDLGPLSPPPTPLQRCE